MGYARKDGQVGTRNYLGIMTSVNCSGSVARFIAEAFEREGWLADYPQIDGVRIEALPASYVQLPSPSSNF